MQRRRYVLFLCAFLASLAAACSSVGPASQEADQTQKAADSPRPQATSTHAPHAAATPDAAASVASAAPAATRRIPAHFISPPPLASLATTLDPASFYDPKVRAAYQAAKEIPQTLAQLPCFCYCDGIGHKSLHTCYENDHSVGCAICQDEALMAQQLKKDGLTDAQIRDRIIATFQ
jgi:hypothetical protein